MFLQKLLDISLVSSLLVFATFAHCAERGSFTIPESAQERVQKILADSRENATPLHLAIGCRGGEIPRKIIELGSVPIGNWLHVDIASLESDDRSTQFNIAKDWQLHREQILALPFDGFSSLLELHSTEFQMDANRIENWLQIKQLLTRENVQLDSIVSEFASFLDPEFFELALSLLKPGGKLIQREFGVWGLLEVTKHLPGFCRDCRRGKGMCRQASEQYIAHQITESGFPQGLYKNESDLLPENRPRKIVQLTGADGAQSDCSQYKRNTLMELHSTLELIEGRWVSSLTEHQVLEVILKHFAILQHNLYFALPGAKEQIDSVRVMQHIRPGKLPYFSIEMLEITPGEYVMAYPCTVITKK